MATLLDLADRLSHNVAAVHEAAQNTGLIRSSPNQTAGPFTAALLSSKPLMTFLRDSYPGESRLLTLSHETEYSSMMKTIVGGLDAEHEEVEEVAATLAKRQIVSATPLRRRNEVGPSGEGGDLFLKSAIKLIERYQIKQDVKYHVEDLLERYHKLQVTAKTLRDTLAQTLASRPIDEAPQSQPGTAVQGNEEAIRDLEVHIAEARKKRDALRLRLQSQKVEDSLQGQPPQGENVSSDSWPSPALPDGTHPLPSGLNFGDRAHKPPPPGEREKDFWSADPHAKSPPKDAEAQEEDGDGDETIIITLNPRVHDSQMSDLSPIRPTPPTPLLRLSERILNSPSKPFSSASGRHRLLPPPVMKVLPAAEVVVQVPHNTFEDPIQTTNAAMEKIVSHLWSTVGEVIHPGNRPDSPPSFAETISILEERCNLSTKDMSTSVLTSKCVLVLLRAPGSNDSTSGPSPVPMASLKQVVDELAAEKGFGVGLGVRTVYSCVAKKLLRIDRHSAKEPMVEFNLP